MAREEVRVFSFYANKNVNACAFVGYIKNEHLPLFGYRFGGINSDGGRLHYSREEFATMIPQFLQSEKSVKKLADVFGLGACEVISERVKDIIETLEPGIHQFFPVTVLNHLGEAWPGNYYIFRVMTVLSALHVDRSGVKWFKLRYDVPPGKPLYSLGISNPREYYFNKDRVKGHHFWIHEPDFMNDLFCSQEARSALLSAKIPYLCWKKKECIVIDSPWHPEGNVQPFDDNDPKIFIQPPMINSGAPDPSKG
jgi:hypothetical protein